MPCEIGIREIRTVSCPEPGCSFTDDSALTQTAAEDIADAHDLTHSTTFPEGEDA
jgi:hypothetical protein